MSELLRLRRFDVSTCKQQLSSAPEDVVRYSQFSWQARRLVSEEVTEAQN